MRIHPLPRLTAPLSLTLSLASTSLAQTCSPYFADLGRSSHPFLGSYFAEFDDGTGDAIYRGDYLDPTLLRWTGFGWQEESLAGAPNGFVPQAPLSFKRGIDAGLYLGGRVGNADVLLRRVGAQWQLSGICYGNQCPPFEVIGGGLMQADVGDGVHFYAFGVHPQESMYRVARWDGTSWTDLGASTRTVWVLIEYNDGTGPALYALGDFTAMAGVPAAGMAKWDGHAWTAATPPDNRVLPTTQAVVANLGDGPAIYVLANVLMNGADHFGLNKWDGTAWTFLGGAAPFPPPSSPPEVLCLAAFDDGRGPAVYVGGVFGAFGNTPAHNIVRFDGQHFEALGAGIIGEVRTLVPFHDVRGPALYAWGDEITGAGGGTLNQPAVLWVGCPNCYANCDLSTAPPRLNVNDFICFTQKFATQDPYANCDANATIDINDFVCFMTRFAQGCGP